MTHHAIQTDDVQLGKQATLRPELDPLPPQMRDLPVARGYPVPWFVAWPDGPAGEPEFRMVEPDRFGLAVSRKLCWVCGKILGRQLTFVLGPMCGINRTSAEPPCHRDCARWSARNCPFLSKPHMERREDDVTAAGVEPAGHMIRRNPGSTLLWTTRSFRLVNDGNGRLLIRVGDPTAVEWYSNGRPATRAEVAHSVNTGLPILEAMAREEGPDAVAALRRLTSHLEAMYP